MSLLVIPSQCQSTLYVGSLAKQPRLTSGDFYLRIIAQVLVQPSRHAEFHACHEVDVEDLPAVATKEQLQFEALFQARARAWVAGFSTRAARSCPKT